MSYSDFTLQGVIEQFNLIADGSADLFSHIPPVPVRPAFMEILATFGPLALTARTEKARSEYLIAPVLAEVWFMKDRQISVFSGVELNADPDAGLKGVCGFLLAHSHNLPLLQAPIMAVVEAKRDDVLEGMGQCVAAMIGVQRFNAKQGKPTETVYGCVTTGNAWRFLRLKGNELSIDLPEYALSRTEQIIAIFLHIVSQT